MPRLIFLTLSLIFLISCAGQKSPIDYVTIVDIQANEGTQFKFKNKRKLQVDNKPFNRIELKELNGYVCLSPEQYLDLKYWVVDMIKEVETRQKLYQCSY